MSKKPDTWSKVLTVAPTVKGMTDDNLKKIRQRGKLPPKWNYPFVSAAEQAGIELTYDEIVKFN